MYQYSLGLAVAINITERHINNELGFRDKYSKFLKVGNSLSVNQSLKLLDIDLNNDCYLDEAFIY